jgi:hypothetical protein
MAPGSSEVALKALDYSAYLGMFGMFRTYLKSTHFVPF